MISDDRDEAVTHRSDLGDGVRYLDIHTMQCDTAGLKLHSFAGQFHDFLLNICHASFVSVRDTTTVPGQECHIWADKYHYEMGVTFCAKNCRLGSPITFIRCSTAMGLRTLTRPNSLGLMQSEERLTVIQLRG